MGNRLQLQTELETFIPTVYFQPPSNITMQYPCIVYGRAGVASEHANDRMYSRTQEYQVTLIERNPDSNVGDNILSHFSKCRITQQFSVDNLNHTIYTLFY